MGIASRRAAAAVLLLVVAVAAAFTGVAAEQDENGTGVELSCFCDCMKNRCMTLGTGPNKFDCASACTEGCTQIGQPGQPNGNNFCGF
uniref:Uncharacterized protein n=1 Tax=Leersia perrieri TaxID=77586 RepID=A0A0D9VTS5_9ORYZ